MPTVAYFIAFLLTIGTLTEGTTYTSVVQTEDGPVRGEILSTIREKVSYASFSGIPYAEPPVGELRFKPPVKKEKWTEVLDAVQEGNVCPQYLRSNNSQIGAEDCLFLNIHTPLTDLSNVKQTDLKAVLFWIHGGGFLEGSGNRYMNGPDYIIEDDVLLVTFNYRLGPLGFLTVNNKNALGNAGLKDQNLALKWVNNNIEKFGGDPKKITIIGQSAGSVSVDLHILSDMSAGLFKQSIAMSGSPLCLVWGLQSRHDGEKKAFELGSKLGINTKNKDELLESLYKLPATDILEKAHEMNLMPFRPVVESWLTAIGQEKFLSQCPVDKYNSGKYNKGPHLMGFVNAEAKALSETDIPMVVNNALDAIANSSIPFVSPILQKLIDAGSFSKLPSAIAKQLIQTITDLVFVTGIDTKQQLLRNHNGHPIYYYRFSQDTSEYPGFLEDKNHLNITGAGHADDMPYLFYFSDVGLPSDPAIEKTSRRLVRFVTNFAKSGNPTPDGSADPLLDITWPDSGLLGRSMEINTELSTKLRPTNAEVIAFEALGLGRSRFLNSCFD